MSAGTALAAAVLLMAAPTSGRIVTRATMCDPVLPKVIASRDRPFSPMGDRVQLWGPGGVRFEAVAGVLAVGPPTILARLLSGSMLQMQMLRALSRPFAG